MSESVVRINPVEAPVVKKFPSKKINLSSLIFPVLVSLTVLLMGTGTGWLLAGRPGATLGQNTQKSQSELNLQSDMEAGIADEEAFPDTAEGELKEGGIKGEGTHQLDRGLGEEKNVYLTSTVINLDNFVGKKVQVWGQTVTAKYAGWLMDVGKIKVLQ
ncbi:hypothetical protein A2691_00015 [Candidatus Woesebacteria bacterium RIFCSPHIGHO2_01_FULL_39_23]|nr:MAG: hypothetical protein A2691_00015 [Candidatus Woesebacteria bacterium RIFCSPHIGHO2_01_FULL_39_23]